MHRLWIYIYGQMPLEHPTSLVRLYPRSMPGFQYLNLQSLDQEYMKYGTHEWCSMYIIIKHEMNQEKANLIITATSIQKNKSVQYSIQCKCSTLNYAYCAFTLFYNAKSNLKIQNLPKFLSHQAEVKCPHRQLHIFNSLKTIPFTAAHTYIAHIWQYHPWEEL